MTQRTIPCPLSMAGRTETGQIYHLRHNFGFIRFHSNELLSIFFLKSQLKEKELNIGEHVEFECVSDGNDRLLAENIRHISSQSDKIQIRKGVVEKIIVDRRFEGKRCNVFGFIASDDLSDISDVDNENKKNNIYFNVINFKNKSLKLQRGTHVLFTLIEDKLGRLQARVLEILNDDDVEVGNVENTQDGDEEEQELKEKGEFDRQERLLVEKDEEIKPEKEEGEEKGTKEEKKNEDDEDKREEKEINVKEEHFKMLEYLDDEMKKKLNAVDVNASDKSDNDCKDAIMCVNCDKADTLSKKEDLQLLDVSECYQDVRHGSF